MKKGITLLTPVAVLLFIAPLSAWAQPGNEVHISGGLSYLRQDSAFSGLEPGHSPGWFGGLSVGLTPRIAVAAELGGSYGDRRTQTPQYSNLKEDSNIESYLFGPEIRLLRKDRIELSTKALLGVARGEFATSVPAASPLSEIRWTSNGRAGAFGGAVDVYFSHNIAWRVAQPELLWTTFNGSTHKDFRVATGVVLRLGGRR